MHDLAGDVISSVALYPQTVANAAAASGSAVDRRGYDGGVICCTVGATAGVPTTLSMAFKVEESADNAEWTAITGKTSTLTSKDSSGEINLDLTGVKRYIRLVVTGTLTGGSSPTGTCAGIVTLGQARALPVA